MKLVTEQDAARMTVDDDRLEEVLGLKDGEDGDGPVEAGHQAPALAASLHGTACTPKISAGCSDRNSGGSEGESRASSAIAESSGR